MPWDFETEPAPRERPDRARAFMRDEVWSLECVAEVMDEGLPPAGEGPRT